MSNVGDDSVEEEWEEGNENGKEMKNDGRKEESGKTLKGKEQKKRRRIGESNVTLEAYLR